MHLCKARVLQLCLAVSAVLALSDTAIAANTPCSGSKGGIAGCDGDLFLCKDGFKEKLLCLLWRCFARGSSAAGLG